MFQTIMKLFDSRLVVPNKDKYIYFGASIIYCDEKNVCSVYYNPVDNNVIPSTDIKNVVSSS